MFDPDDGSTLDLPVFLALDASSAGDNAFPTAIAWSLPNGQVKDALIIPDDDWDDEDAVDRDFYLQSQTIESYGYTPKDIVTELFRDWDPFTIFHTHQPIQQTQLFIKLLESCGFDAEPTIEPLLQLFDQWDDDQLHDESHLISVELGLQNQGCENLVRIWLNIYQAYRVI